MTRAEIEGLNPQELREAVAERVMGWQWYPIRWNREQKVLAPSPEAADNVPIGYSITHLVPPYSTDMAVAWPLFESLVTRWGEGELVRCPIRRQWLCVIGPENKSISNPYPCGTAWAETPALAVCRAALRALAET